MEVLLPEDRVAVGEGERIEIGDGRALRAAPHRVPVEEMDAGDAGEIGAGLQRVEEREEAVLALAGDHRAHARDARRLLGAEGRVHPAEDDGHAG